MSQDATPPSSVEACVDVITADCIIGWARDVERPDDIVTLELYLGSRRILRHQANRFRPDLVEAGLGSGRYGFEIAVPPEVSDQASRTGERLAVRSEGHPGIDLFSVTFTEVLDLPPEQREVLAERFRSATRRPFQPERFPLSETPSYLALMEPRAMVSPSLPPLFAYAEHVRRTRQLEDRFAPERIASDMHHFLRWYIDDYNVARAPRRAPLSRQVIHWLNEVVVLGGSPFPVTRVMLWYLAENRHGLAALGNAPLYRNLMYWWACEKAPALNIDDCLVSEVHVDYLRGLSRQWIGRPFPLSQFMEEALISRPSLAGGGSIQSVSSRVSAYFMVVAEALEDPGLLRFIPKVVIDRLFSGDPPLFNTLAAAACKEDADSQPLDAQRYRQSLLDRGFDLDTSTFLSVDSAGHRSEAARLGGAAMAVPVDVQLIGPLSKVSGLAHAARQSRAILQATHFNLGVRDFTLDNPQPDQEQKAIEPMAPSRVNLIHINAEMLPLAYAYLPDVHHGAYTIGFFFWEFGEPADCHRLAIDLVDEIWVASEFSRQCFAAWTHKPVVNVGMALDIGPTPDRRAVRSELERTKRAIPNDFVFLTTYDSLSYVSRKNPLGALKAFQAAFPNEGDVRLIIKTHNAASVGAGLARRVWDELLRLAADDSRISVIDETLPYHEVIALKAACDCYVSLHRSEGFGFGMLEAMRLGVPVVCTAYSGNLDFCDDTTAWLVEADEVGVRYSEYAYISPGHRWAEPRHESAVAALRGVKGDAEMRAARASAARARAVDRYSVAAAAGRYGQRIKAILADRPVAPMPSIEASASTETRPSFLSRLRGLS